MALEKIIIVGIPEEINLEQLKFITNEHILELALKEIEVFSEVKKSYPKASATKRKILIQKDNFSLNSYSGSIKYLVRDYDSNLKVHPTFFVGEQEFEYKI